MGSQLKKELDIDEIDRRLGKSWPDFLKFCDSLDEMSDEELKALSDARHENDELLSWL